MEFSVIFLTLVLATEQQVPQEESEDEAEELDFEEAFPNLCELLKRTYAGTKVVLTRPDCRSKRAAYF